MTKAIGIDAVEIERVRRARRRHGAAFDDRIFSEAEQALLAASKAPDEFAAGRFAAKEAVMKVLGTGWAQGVAFREIEVLRAEDGRPLPALSGVAAERARALGIARTLVSITHTRTLAIAMAAGE